MSSFYTLPLEELKRWKVRAVDEISTQISRFEGDNLRIKTARPSTSIFQEVNSGQRFVDEADAYDRFLRELEIAIETNPGRVLETNSFKLESEEKKLSNSSTQSNVIFIVHGHDEPNLYKLKELLKDEYGLTPIVLSSQPGSGKTIIEKFEAEAKKAAFAFVLLTPDDIIRKNNREYGQARPNVVFELGWFYGKLGREKVCILFKKGTEIHSDLNGVSRIEFTEAINEKVQEIRRELKAGGLLNS